MNKIHFLSILFFLYFTGKAQNFPDVPWSISKAKQSIQEDYQKLIFDFEKYKNIDNIKKKGSGIKAFERWRSIWEPYILRKTGFHPVKDIDKAYQKKLHLSTKYLNNSPWISIGPTLIDRNNHLPGKGRVNFVLIDPVDEQIMYVGTPAGGIWKTTNGGLNWIPLTDYLPQIGVSAIALSPTDHNIIYIGTGDDDAQNTYSRGVYKSIDGGLTWNPIGPIFLTDHEIIKEIIIDPQNPDILLVASSDGLYRTSNDGNFWTKIMGNSIKALRMHPTNHNVIYAVSGQNFYRSTDNGQNFSLIPINFSGNPRYMELDVTPAAPQKVYVLVGNTDGSFGGIYVSDDEGQNFSQTQQNTNFFENNNQSWYNFAFAVSDTDPNTLFVGNINISKSTDGGNSIANINSWSDYTPNYTHADIHFLRYYNGKLVAGTDGGIYISTDDGSSFTDYNNNLAISQFYRISINKGTMEQIYGGLQDNGGFSKKINQWRIYHGGDGMDNAIENNDSETGYSFIYYGWNLNITHDGGITVSNGVSVPQGEQGNWITPLEMAADGSLYSGFKKIYKLVNGDWQAQTSNPFIGNIDFIRCNPNNPDQILVAEGNKLYLSNNRGINFTQIYNTSTNITSIEINPFNSKIWITTDNQIYESPDMGTNWTNITGNYPGEHINIIKWHPFSPNNTLYLASDLGVYTRDDSTGNWQVYTSGLPNVPVRDIEINNLQGKMTIATFGRGIWQTDVPSYLPENDLSIIDIFSTTGQTFHCANQAEIQVKVKNMGNNPVNNFTLNYSIDGTNGNINYNNSIQPGDEINISLPIQNFNYQKHTITAQLDYAQDQYIQNNSKERYFIMDKSELLNYQTSFEDPNMDAWVGYRDIGNSIWEIASPAGSILNQTGSGNFAYCTNADGNYSDLTKEYLLSPCFDFSQVIQPQISFKLAFDIEEDWDAFYLQYSTDSGNQWNVLGTASDPNWYNSNTIQSQCLGNQWTGTQANMQTYTHDLSFLSGESQVIFRFVLASDDFVNKEGVVLDDINISGTLGVGNQNLQNNISIFPNPTENQVNILWKEIPIQSIKIINLQGQIVLSYSDINKNSLKLNINQLKKGLYFVQFGLKNGSITKKLLKK